MKIKEALQSGYEKLVLNSDSSRLDAELILSHVLDRPATFLLAHDDAEMSFFTLWKYLRLIEKRRKGIPVSYLTGHREFYGLDFEINEHVLVPRPDTEILVDCVVEYLNNDQCPMSNVQLLDVGTGSACIPISILKNVSKINAIATEISRPAIKIAQENVKKHHLKGRIKLYKSDLLESVPLRLFDDKNVIVTANLPYIPTQFQIDPSTKYEPDVALYGGEDGLDIYKRLVEQLEEIKPKAIFFELFEHQIAILCEYMPDYELKYAKNMTGDAKCLHLALKI
ncbi:peptide chain release factor N(5)-glutamine methyltransferase [Patescibacteria group bacterium]|nr:peptide chain release factor N(5)-glutamine methyltransferase [Patescibacteria group bacterium]